MSDSNLPSKQVSLRMMDENQNKAKKNIQLELSVKSSKQNSLVPSIESSQNNSQMNVSNIEKQNLLGNQGKEEKKTNKNDGMLQLNTKKGTGNAQQYPESNPNLLDLSHNKTDNNLISDANKNAKPSSLIQNLNKKSFREEKSDNEEYSPENRNDNAEKSPSEKEDNKSDNNEDDGEMNIENKRKLEKRDKICDSDTEDEGSDNEKEVRWVILPENDYKKFWDILIALILLYSAIVLPYRIAFVENDGNAMYYLDITFDITFTIDILLSFFTAYVDNEDNVVKNRKKIAINYLKTWFSLDLISVAPISYFYQQSSIKGINQLSRISRIPKISRLLKLTKIFRMVKIMKKGNVNRITKYFLEKLKVNANIERLIYFILAFLLLNHLAACVWYFMAKWEDLGPDSWVMELGYIDSSAVEIYIISFYFTLTTVTTVGYGDIHACTTLERAYNLVIMSFGVLMYSFAIGSLSSIVSTLDAKTAEMNQKLQILASIKNEFKLDNDIYDKVRKVIKYDLSRNQKDKMNFLQELPNKLRIELSKIMHDKIIKQLYFFREQPPDFIAYVAPLLKPVKFSQNDFLYKIGDMIDEMYFVAKGTISFCLSKEYDEKEIKEIKKNNNFGEIEMCLNEKLSYNIKVKSRNCELFVLKKNDFLRLSVNFKEFIEKFLQKSLMIYLKFNEEKKKASKIIEEAKGMTQTANQGDQGDGQGNKYNELDKIEEQDEENQESDEFDIFEDEASSKESAKSDESNEDNSEGEREPQNNNNNNNIMKNSIKSNNMNMQENKFNMNQMNDDGNDKRNSFLNFKALDNNMGKMNKEMGFEAKNSGISKMDNKAKNLINSNKEDNDFDKGDKGDDKGKNLEINDQVEKVKHQMNKKFLKKVDKIIEFIEANDIQFADPSNSPAELLKRLKASSDIYERNELIDKIETIITELFKNQNK